MNFTNSTVFVPFGNTLGTLLITCIVGVATLIFFDYLEKYLKLAIEETYRKVISVNENDPVNPEYENKILHITGALHIEEPLTAADYNISVQAVKLKCTVQMYQWVEKIEYRKRNVNHTTERANTYQEDEKIYTYTKEWKEFLIDSSTICDQIGHYNPSIMSVKPFINVSSEVKVGQLSLGSCLKEQFKDFVEIQSNYKFEHASIKLHEGMYYHCDDLQNFKIGDIRIKFYYSGLIGDMVSIIAQQKFGSLVPHITKSGYDMSLIKTGQHYIGEMYESQISAVHNKVQTGKMVGWVLLVISVVCFLSIFDKISKYI